jgi:hypothetical protein
MPTMSKRRPPAVPPGQPPDDPPSQGSISLTLRIVDPRLIAAVDRCAHDDRRSRNVTLNILLEEALQARGYWPPPPPAQS